MSVMENLAIAGNHIKDIDFIIGNSEALGDEIVEHFGLGLHDKLAEWNQAMYPLEKLQKMLTQLRGIQDSVQAEGMKEEERIDWNGVKMHLFRIFQQEQFIFQMEVANEDYEAVAYDVGTRSPEAPLKRFLFTIHNSSTIPELQGEEIIKKAHCIMYLFEGQKMIQGFMHLKEYTELKEITKLLKIDTKYTDFEACEVRGSTEDIINGTAQIKLIEAKKQAE